MRRFTAGVRTGRGTAPQPQPRPDTAQDDGYRRRYVLNRWDGAFRSGKTVRIRPEHYERLRQITARSGAVSMIAYVDNVLAEHLRQHKDEIAELYRSGIDDILQTDH